MLHSLHLHLLHLSAWQPILVCRVAHQANPEGLISFFRSDIAGASAATPFVVSECDAMNDRGVDHSLQRECLRQFLDDMCSHRGDLSQWTTVDERLGCRLQHLKPIKGIEDAGAQDQGSVVFQESDRISR